MFIVQTYFYDSIDTYVCSLLLEAALRKKRFQNLFKVLFSAAIEYLEKLIKEFFIMKMDRNSPSCRSLTGVALSGSCGGCCTPTSGRDTMLIVKILWITYIEMPY